MVFGEDGMLLERPPGSAAASASSRRRPAEVSGARSQLLPSNVKRSEPWFRPNSRFTPPPPVTDFRGEELDAVLELVGLSCGRRRSRHSWLAPVLPRRHRRVGTAVSSIREQQVLRGCVIFSRRRRIISSAPGRSVLFVDRGVETIRPRSSRVLEATTASASSAPPRLAAMARSAWYFSSNATASASDFSGRLQLCRPCSVEFGEVQS